MRKFRKKSRDDAKAWREGDHRRETATGNEVGVGKESCERPKPSSSNYSHVPCRRGRDAARKEARSRRESIELN
jgi:hypothetical protein